MDMELRRRVEEMSGASVLKCMRCGKCSATCPNYDEMEYHPHQFVYMVEKGEVEKLMNSKSIFTCLYVWRAWKDVRVRLNPQRLSKR